VERPVRVTPAFGGHPQTGFRNVSGNEPVPGVLHAQELCPGHADDARRVHHDEAEVSALGFEHRVVGDCGIGKNLLAREAFSAPVHVAQGGRTESLDVPIRQRSDQREVLVVHGTLLQGS